jgi:hypothetical protein
MTLHRVGDMLWRKHALAKQLTSNGGTARPKTGKIVQLMCAIRKLRPTILTSQLAFANLVKVAQ